MNLIYVTKYEWYENIVISWENGTTIGYSDVEKIKTIAKIYVKMYRKYDEDIDIFEEERNKKLKNEEWSNNDHKKYGELIDKCISEASINMLENVASGKAYFEGSKGGIWLTGGIFNYTPNYIVLDELFDFFKELKKVNSIHGNVVEIREYEQSDETDIYILNTETMETKKVGKGEKWCWRRILF